MASALAALRETYAPEKLDEAIEAQVAKLDAIVGSGLGLSIDDIKQYATSRRQKGDVQNKK